MAAALLVMVSNLTIGRKKFAAVESEVTEIRAETERLREVALKLVDDDVAAYQQVVDAMRLPRDTEEEKAARRSAVQAALKGAAGPPLRTMTAAADVLVQARELVGIGNPSAISDVGTAAAAARAGFHAARLNVEINVAGVHDEGWRQDTLKALASMPDVDVLEREIIGAAEIAARGGA
jgi:formiminotetrahydrofolate cyclodeaminase